MNEKLSVFTFRLPRQLKNLIGKLSDERGMTMNEYIAKVLAEHVGDPELGKIKRKPPGRKYRPEE